MSEKSGSMCPMFLGYYEESHYRAPHYQSVVPIKMNSILQSILDNEGFDVRSLSLSGWFYFMHSKVFKSVKA